MLAGLLLAGCDGKLEPEVRHVRVVEVPVQVLRRAPVVAVPPLAAASLRLTVWR